MIAAGNGYCLALSQASVHCKGVSNVCGELLTILGRQEVNPPYQKRRQFFHFLLTEECQVVGDVSQTLLRSTSFKLWIVRKLRYS